MALTLSEKFRMSDGGKAWRFYKITLDGTTSSFTAASVDLNYVEFVANCGCYMASDVVNTSALAQALVCTTNYSTVDVPTGVKTGSKVNLMMIGW